jgi:hypothetical protein
LKTVTVVATYLRADGTPLQGTVSFHPPSPLVSTVSNALISGDVVAPIQADGTITATLVACDDPTISPTGFTYQVTETFTGAQGRTYNISLSYLASQPIDLMPVTPSSPNAGNVTYVAGPGVPSGGAAGALLFKNSTTDYDTSWKSPAAAGVLPLNGGTMTGAITSVGASTNSVAEQSQVTGDTWPRFTQLAGGYMNWGSGAASGDANLYRGAAGILKTDNSLTVLTRLGVGQNAPSVSTIGVTTAADQAGIKLLNTNASGNLGNAAVAAISATNTSLLASGAVNGDANPRFTQTIDGRLAWGTGSAGTDTDLYRSAAGVLKTDNTLSVGQGFAMSRTTVSDAAYTVLPTDSRVCYTALTAARVVTLPLASTMSAGQVITVKDESGACSGTNTITITPASGTIDGAANKVVNTAYGVLRVYAAGSNWFTW